MANKNDDGLGAKLESAAKMVERATRAIEKVTGQSPRVLIPSVPGFSDEAAKALIDKAEEHFAKAEADRAAADSMMEEIEAAMEDSRTRERRREMAIEKILASENFCPDRVDETKAPAKPATNIPPQSARILRDMPRCGATWEMKQEIIVRKIKHLWKQDGNPYHGEHDSLVRAVKKAKEYRDMDQ
jgi:hypothetical protein